MYNTGVIVLVFLLCLGSYHAECLRGLLKQKNIAILHGKTSVICCQKVHEVRNVTMTAV